MHIADCANPLSEILGACVGIMDTIRWMCTWASVLRGMRNAFGARGLGLRGQWALQRMELELCRSYEKVRDAPMLSR